MVHNRAFFCLFESHKKLYYLHSIGTINFPRAKQVATKVSKFLEIEDKELPAY